MEWRKATLFSMILLLVAFCLAPAAMAARGCAGVNVEPENFIVVDKTAPGTKYNVTLTIYYDNSATCSVPSGSNMKDMYFFARMEGNIIQGDHNLGGPEMFSFAGIGECVPYWNGVGHTAEEAAALQQEAVMEFFRLTVNPAIYHWNHPDDLDGCDPDISDPVQACPSFAIKSVDSIVEDSGWPLSSGLYFLVMDMVIAIED